MGVWWLLWGRTPVQLNLEGQSVTLHLLHLQLLSGHFDTTSGSKGEATSYARIAADLGVAPADLVFFSDRIEGKRTLYAFCGKRRHLIARGGKKGIIASL